MTFEQIMNTISGGINYLYEEDIEDIKEIEDAEEELYKTIKFLEQNGIHSLEDLKKVCRKVNKNENNSILCYISW